MKFPKKNTIDSENLAQLAVTFGILTFQKMYINQTRNL